MGKADAYDVGVDCGPRDPSAMMAALPKLVIEVLSPNECDFDSFRKLEEYKGVASVDYILLVEPNEPLVRSGQGPDTPVDRAARAGWRRPSKCPIWQ